MGASFPSNRNVLLIRLVPFHTPVLSGSTLHKGPSTRSCREFEATVSLSYCTVQNYAEHEGLMFSEGTMLLISRRDDTIYSIGEKDVLRQTNMGNIPRTNSPLPLPCCRGQVLSL